MSMENEPGLYVCVCVREKEKEIERERGIEPMRIWR